jgi:hypothetical protein
MQPTLRNTTQSAKPSNDQVTKVAYDIEIYFKLQMGFYPGSITITIQHTNVQVTYTIHISHTHIYTYHTT